MLTLNRDLLERILKATRWAERQMRNRPPRRGRWQPRGSGSSANSWRRFELKTDLTGSSSSATAYLLDETATRTATEFTVYDLFIGFEGDGSTESGMDGSDEGTGNKGWALYRSDSEKWEIIQLNC